MVRIRKRDLEEAAGWHDIDPAWLQCPNGDHGFRELTHDPEACRDLARRGTSGAFLYFPLWLVIVFSTPLWREMSLFSSIVATFLAGFGAIRAYLHFSFDRQFPADPRRWYRLYFICVVGMALCWSGAVVFIFLLYPLSWAAVITTSATAGVASGANISLSSHGYLQRTYIILTLVPPGLVLIMGGNSSSIALGALFLVFVIYLFIFGRQVRLQYWTGLWNRRLLSQRAQELEQARARAEANANAKSEFLANMSHELRTPLNAILGFAQIMNRSENLGTTDRSNLAVINRSGEHLLSLINQILDMSKIEAGRITLEPSAFDLHWMLRDLEAMFALKAERQGLDFRFHWPKDLPRYVVTDEVKLRQILINLLNNAIKFTTAGRVELRARVKTAPQHHLRDLAKIAFEVEDTGPGISAQEQSELFKTFAQTSSGRESREGTGLGLAICHRFATLLGGAIGVQSDHGHGATFFFDVQIEIAEPVPAPLLDPSQRVIGIAPGQPPFRLLIVDDQKDNRDLLAQLLSQVGFEVGVAENGIEGVAQWKALRPHLTWMEMRMPGMTGYEATSAIKQAAREAGVSTKVVALTASSMLTNRELMAETGCDDYLSKPLRETDVFDVLIRHLGVQFLFDSEQRPELNEIQSQVPLSSDFNLQNELLRVSPQWRDEMQRAVESADLDNAEALVQALPDDRSDLARYLQGCLQQYEFQKVQEALEVVPRE